MFNPLMGTGFYLSFFLTCPFYWAAIPQKHDTQTHRIDAEPAAAAGDVFKDKRANSVSSAVSFLSAFPVQ